MRGIIPDNTSLAVWSYITCCRMLNFTSLRRGHGFFHMRQVGRGASERGRKCTGHGVQNKSDENLQPWALTKQLQAIQALLVCDSACEHTCIFSLCCKHRTPDCVSSELHSVRGDFESHGLAFQTGNNPI